MKCPFRIWMTVVALVGVLAGCESQSGLAADTVSDAQPTASLTQPPARSVTRLAALLPAQDPTSTELNQQIAESRETAIVRASERVAPSVVTVYVLRTEQVPTRDPFFDFFPGFGGFGGTTAQTVPALGSGFVVDPDGLILTNDHVVRDADRILVTFPDGRDAEAELVGADETADVAVLRVQESDLPAIPVGGTDDLRIGEWVIALGNPFGNMFSNPEPTVTVGVVSAVGRHIVPSQEDRGFYLGMIQTDAAINPGNSGGPLVNAAGQVIGMNASIFSRSGGSEGMGFAIPIERVLRIADDLVQFGEVHRAWLGIAVEAEQGDSFGRSRGVRVTSSASGSPADRVGIRPGDRLLSVNGRRLATPLDFEAAMLDLRAGDGVSLSVDGKDEVRLVADELPSLLAERVRVFQDLELVTLTASIRSERGIQSEQGALVTGISPRLRDTLGLQDGDVIVGLNQQLVQDAQDLTAMLDRIPANVRVRLWFERNQNCCMASDFVLGR